MSTPTSRGSLDEEALHSNNMMCVFFSLQRLFPDRAQLQKSPALVCVSQQWLFSGSVFIFAALTVTTWRMLVSEYSPPAIRYYEKCQGGLVIITYSLKH